MKRGERGAGKVTGQLRTELEDHSAITDPLGVTYTMWDSPNTH